MIRDTRHAHTGSATKDKMIELFTLQSHPKDLLNLTAHSRSKPTLYFWIEQRIIEDNHINNKSLLLLLYGAKGEQIFVAGKLVKF